MAFWLWLVHTANCHSTGQVWPRCLAGVSLSFTVTAASIPSVTQALPSWLMFKDIGVFIEVSEGRTPGYLLVDLVFASPCVPIAPYIAGVRFPDHEEARLELGSRARMSLPSRLTWSRRRRHTNSSCSRYTGTWHSP